MGYSGALYSGSSSESVAIVEGPFSSGGQVNIKVCAVNEVPLWVRLVSAASFLGRTAYYAVLDINATKAGPFNEQTYRKILSEVK